MWYVASMIRGMSIDEALKQLSFVNKKGAVHVKEVLLEAQKLAVEKNNVEFKGVDAFKVTNNSLLPHSLFCPARRRRTSETFLLRNCS